MAMERGVHRAWIGARRGDAAFYWATPFDTGLAAAMFDSVDVYTAWGHGEPNDYGGTEDCVAMWKHRGYEWADYGCEREFHYMCEFDCPRCTPVDDGRCFEMMDDSMAWGDAHAHCSAHGGNLAHIRSEAEQDVAEALATRHNAGNVWLGGRRGDDGGFSWVPPHGSTGLIEFDDAGVYTAWGRGEPNNWHGNEDCLCMYRGRAHDWADHVCGEENRFLCEFPVQAAGGDECEADFEEPFDLRRVRSSTVICTHHNTHDCLYMDADQTVRMLSIHAIGTPLYRRSGFLWDIEETSQGSARIESRRFSGYYVAVEDDEEGAKTVVVTMDRSRRAAMWDLQSISVNHRAVHDASSWRIRSACDGGFMQGTEGSHDLILSHQRDRWDGRWVTYPGSLAFPARRGRTTTSDRTVCRATRGCGNTDDGQCCPGLHEVDGIVDRCCYAWEDRCFLRDAPACTYDGTGYASAVISIDFFGR